MARTSVGYDVVGYNDIVAFLVIAWDGALGRLAILSIHVSRGRQQCDSPHRMLHRF